MNWLADETGRLLIRLSDIYVGDFKTSVSNMGEVLKAEPASRLLELALNETYDQAFLDEFQLQITDVFASIDDLNQVPIKTCRASYGPKNGLGCLDSRVRAIFYDFYQ